MKETILAYRSYGVPIREIATILDRDEDIEQERILRNQFASLEQEIQKLHQQQKAIVLLLEQPALLEQQMVNKERWTDIMKAAGFDGEAMKNWHKQFEKMEPEAHQEFLESLSIDKEEIRQIRAWSRS